MSISTRSSRSNSISNIVSALYTLPRMPERTLSNSNSLHRHDFVIQIDPSSSNALSSTSTPYQSNQRNFRTGSTTSVSDYYETPGQPLHGDDQARQFYMNNNASTHSILNHHHAAKRIQDLEAHLNYQNEQMRMIVWERDEWKNRNHALESELRRIQEQSGSYEHLIQDCETLKSQNDVFLSNIKLLQTRVAESNKERDELRGKHQMLEIYLNQLQAKYSGYDVLLQERDDLYHENQQSSKLRLENENMTAEITRLREEVNLYMKQRDDLITENGAFKFELHQAKEDSGQLRQHLAELQAEYNRACEHSESSSRQSNDHSSEGLHSDLEDYFHSTSNSTVTEAAIEKSRQVYDNLRPQPQRHDSKFSDNTETIHQANNEPHERQSASSTKPSIDHQSDATCHLFQKKDIHELSVENNNLNSEVERLHNEIHALIRERDELTNQNKNLIPEIDMLRRQREELKGHNNEFAIEAGRLKERFSGYLSQNNDLQVQNHDLATELSRVQQVCNNLVRVRDDLKTQNTTLSTKVTELQNENQNLIQEKHGLVHEFNILKSQHNQLQQYVEEPKCDKELEAVRVELEHLKKELENITHQEKVSKEQNNNLTLQLSQLRYESGRTIKKQKEKFEMQIEQSSTQADVFRKDHDNLQIEAGTLKLQIQHLQEESKNLARQKEELIRQKEEWKAENGTLNAELVKLQKEIENTTEECNELKTQNDSLNVANIQFQNEGERMHKEHNEACKKYEEMHKQNGELFAEIQHLKQEIGRHQKRCEDLLKQNTALASEMGRINDGPSHNQDVNELQRVSNRRSTIPATSLRRKSTSNIGEESRTSQTPTVIPPAPPLPSNSDQFTTELPPYVRRTSSIINRSPSVRYSRYSAVVSTSPTPSEPGSSQVILSQSTVSNVDLTSRELPLQRTQSQAESTYFSNKKGKLAKSRKDSVPMFTIVTPPSQGQKQIILCGHCHENPVQKKLFSKGQSRYCSSKCKKSAKNASKEETGYNLMASSETTLNETASIYSYATSNLSSHSIKHAY